MIELLATRVLVTLVDKYFEFFSKLISRIEVRIGISGVQFSLKQELHQDIDERIEKIDAARQNLIEGISAIDDLKAEAERNKQEAEKIERQVIQLDELRQKLQQDRDALQKHIQKDAENFELERQVIQGILDSDIEAFRRVARVPSSADIRKERIIGFISGISASVVATGLVFGLTQAFTYLSEQQPDPLNSTPNIEEPQPKSETQSSPPPKSEIQEPQPGPDTQLSPQPESKIQKPQLEPETQSSSQPESQIQESQPGPEPPSPQPSSNIQE